MPDIAKEYWKMDKVHALPSLIPICMVLNCISCGPVRSGEVLLEALPSKCLTSPCLLHDE